MFNTVKALFKPKQPTPAVSKNWKVGMWVMVNDKIAILAKIDVSSTVHYINETTGETVGVEDVPIAAIRQARWLEIPEKRRLISEELGKELGYGA